MLLHGAEAKANPSQAALSCRKVAQQARQGGAVKCGKQQSAPNVAYDEKRS